MVKSHLTGVSEGPRLGWECVGPFFRSSSGGSDVEKYMPVERLYQIDAKMARIRYQTGTCSSTHLSLESGLRSDKPSHSGITWSSHGAILEEVPEPGDGSPRVFHTFTHPGHGRQCSMVRVH